MRMDVQVLPRESPGHVYFHLTFVHYPHISPCGCTTCLTFLCVMYDLRVKLGLFSYLLVLWSTYQRGGGSSLVQCMSFLTQ